MTTRYDVNLINPFLEAVLAVLTTMAHVNVTPGKPYINTERKASGDVTGLIGFTGFARGVMSLTLSRSAILKITNNMLSETYTEIDGNVIDAVGELTNMISGQARMHLSKAGMTSHASTPTVVVGTGHVLNHITEAPVLAIPFSTEFGPLVVEFSLDRSRQGMDSKPRPDGPPEKHTLWSRPKPPKPADRK